jgi:hypothetical protein
MRYSIERVDRGRPQPAIVLCEQDEEWSPEDGQVEIPVDEAGRHADLHRLRGWRRVEFEHDRLAMDYSQLETMLSR